MLFAIHRHGIMPEGELCLNLTTKPGLCSQLVADPELPFDRRNTLERAVDLNAIPLDVLDFCSQDIRAPMNVSHFTSKLLEIAICFGAKLLDFNLRRVATLVENFGMIRSPKIWPQASCNLSASPPI